MDRLITIKNEHKYNIKDRNLDQFFTFYDWKGAYDHVDHDILLKVLKEINVSDLCLRVVSIILFNCRASLDGIHFFSIQKGVP